MLHHNRPLALLLPLVLRPPGTKLRADLLETVTDIGQPGCARVAPACHAKQRQLCAGIPTPIDQHLAQPEIGEVIPDHMALAGIATGILCGYGFLVAYPFGALTDRHGRRVVSRLPTMRILRFTTQVL